MDGSNDKKTEQSDLVLRCSIFSKLSLVVAAAPLLVFVCGKRRRGRITCTRNAALVMIRDNEDDKMGSRFRNFYSIRVVFVPSWK